MTPPDPTATAPLADRAHRAADRYRAATAEFATRHTNWACWTRRATTAHAVATAFGVPADAVIVTNDDTRAYGISGQYPGDMITISDPASERVLQMLPDPTAHGHGWLLLGSCGHCEATVPVARIATLADLGAALDTPGEHLPPECHGDPAHRSDCVHAHHYYRRLPHSED